MPEPTTRVSEGRHMGGSGAYHEERSNDPVDDDTEGYLPPDLGFLEHQVQSLEADLTHDGIHHDQQPNSYSHQHRTNPRKEERDVPMGTDTPTNVSFCKAGPVLGTNSPSMMPMAMARKIHTARKRSSQPRLLYAEVLLVSGASPGCFSGSAASWMGGLGEVTSS
jgi:hypothetical protein